ncbi:uncharacterized protein METZ01_LOCUS45780 [marine metagenome]|uniref:Uncharacterized protein n=1 Tax=marine metagenome TaxID=408172 RepID=A0A381RM39_9ZZZZ
MFNVEVGKTHYVLVAMNDVTKIVDRDQALTVLPAAESLHLQQ